MSLSAEMSCTCGRGEYHGWYSKTYNLTGSNCPAVGVLNKNGSKSVFPNGLGHVNCYYFKHGSQKEKVLVSVVRSCAKRSCKGCRHVPEDAVYVGRVGKIDTYAFD
jgi:hypothetical protein